MFLFPGMAFAQQSWHKFSPLDNAWKYVGTPFFSAGEADAISLAFSPSGQPYVACDDSEKGNRITVMKFNGINWVDFGNAGFSAGFALSISLAFSPSSEPYVAYQDGGNLNKATVMKFDGTTWVDVGNAGFSAGAVQGTSLAIRTSDGQPYVAYQDGDSANYLKATVMKFDGTSWVNVGNAGFSIGKVWYLSFEFSPSGEPYLAYQDWANSYKATVMKFDGTNWVNVGNPAFSAGNAGFTSLAFSPSGQPYIAFEDCGNNCGTTVIKFDGTNWVNVGPTSFSFTQADFTNLAFGPSDSQPYVAYRDYGNSEKATVMKYDSVFVGINELQKSRLSIYPNPATDKITIETSVATQESKLSIVNIEGQQVITRQITEPTATIDIKTLPSGVYLVRLTNYRTVEVGKIVKQ